MAGAGLSPKGDLRSGGEDANCSIIPSGRRTATSWTSVTLARTIHERHWITSELGPGSQAKRCLRPTARCTGDATRRARRTANRMDRYGLWRSACDSRESFSQHGAHPCAVLATLSSCQARCGPRAESSPRQIQRAKSQHRKLRLTKRELYLSALNCQATGLAKLLAKSLPTLCHFMK